MLNRKNNKLVSYNPFHDIDEFERNFFTNPFGSFFRSNDLAEFKIDVTDEGDHYEMEADLPGFEKNDIHLDINGDTLKLSAERHSKIEEKDKKDKIIHMERSYGSFSRQFDVSDIDTDAIKAKYENGVLKLTLPKKHPSLPGSKKLEIE